jgi:hypothetical protein
MDWDLLLVVVALWLTHVVVTVPVVVPVVWLSRRSVRWHWWETANLGEAYDLSGVVTSTVVIRAGVARGIENRIVPMLLIAGATFFAAAVYYATPMWPEE